MNKNKLVYVSIDLETTGIDRKRHQILEIGAVAQEARGKELGTFDAVIARNTLFGSTFALDMNKRLLQIVARGGGEPASEAFPRFREWLEQFIVGDERPAVNAAGKNFEGFDRVFLDNERNFDGDKIFHRRVLDPVSMYARLTDTQPPCLAECLVRAGLSSQVTHNALDDAIQVRDVIERFWVRTIDSRNEAAAAASSLFMYLDEFGYPEEWITAAQDLAINLDRK